MGAVSVLAVIRREAPGPFVPVGDKATVRPRQGWVSQGPQSGTPPLRGFPSLTRCPSTGVLTLHLQLAGGVCGLEASRTEASGDGCGKGRAASE